MTANPIPRDYWLVADTREQVRELARQLIWQSGISRGQAVRYLDYLGEQGRWCACVTIVAVDHDPVRAVHDRIAFGGQVRMMHVGHGGQLREKVKE